MLNVHKIKSKFLSCFRGAVELLDDSGDFPVRKDRIGLPQPQPSIQDRVVIQDARLCPVVRVRPAESPRMRQLQSDQKSIFGTGHLYVFFDEHPLQLFQAIASVWRNYKLIRIRPPFMRNSNRFSSPDEFRSALTEAPPTANRKLAGLSIRGPIPTLHRLNRDPVANANSCALERQ